MVGTLLFRGVPSDLSEATPESWPGILALHGADEEYRQLLMEGIVRIAREDGALVAQEARGIPASGALLVPTQKMTQLKRKILLVRC